MKKVIFGIFAHPDDEAFGPSGTLIKEVQDSTELHLITLTSGEAGQNPDNLPNLGKVRDTEWRKAGKLIGASGMHNLKLRDGHLNNTTMQLASKRIMKIIRDIITSSTTPLEIEFMAFEPNGISGHIDHIVATRTASFVFYRLKEEGLPLTKIRYYCLSEEDSPIHRTDWIFANKGHAEHEIDETVDARYLRDEIITVMKTHYTQRGDCQTILKRQGDKIGLNHFIVDY